MQNSKDITNIAARLIDMKKIQDALPNQYEVVEQFIKEGLAVHQNNMQLIEKLGDHLEDETNEKEFGRYGHELVAQQDYFRMQRCITRNKFSVKQDINYTLQSIEWNYNPGNNFKKNLLEQYKQVMSHY